jgi:hypothetical protein
LRVSDNKVLKTIFGPDRDEVKGQWRRLHEEHFNLQPLTNIIRVITTSIKRWAGHVAGMGTGAYRVLVEHLKEKDHLGVDGRTKPNRSRSKMGRHGLDR